jgi:hypothetical protein
MRKDVSLLIPRVCESFVLSKSNGATTAAKAMDNRDPRQMAKKTTIDMAQMVSAIASRLTSPSSTDSGVE